MTYQEYCTQHYRTSYAAAMTLFSSYSNFVPADKRETAAQKKAIQDTIIAAMQTFPGVDTEDLWRAIYGAHVHRKSGVDNTTVIEQVISADQSWKKSSGHAFEEFIKENGSSALRSDSIEIVLQRDLNQLIKDNKIDNEQPDIDWLKVQINANIFDLYAIVTTSAGKRFCYGCIQSKTSIRDRVTRDREPSMHAMQRFFWSAIVTLDGSFLKLPKFIHMVNGGNDEFPENGWHGMYVFSEKYSDDRIYPTDLSFKNFKEHAIRAARMWLTQRQWFNGSWKA